MARSQSAAGFVVSGPVAYEITAKPSGRGGAAAEPEVQDKTVLALDFYNGLAKLDGATSLLDTVLTCDRASLAYAADATGEYRSFSANTLTRIDGRGLALSGSFVNKVRNPRGEGGVAGVVGSGGAWPTNWNSVGAPSGVFPEFVGTGTEFGLPYADIRYSGIAGSGAAGNCIIFEDTANAVATTGQAWALDFRAKLVAGTAPDIAARLTAYAANTPLAGSVDSAGVALDASVKYLSVRRVLSDTTVNNVRGAVVMPLVSGTSYDFTIRLYAPKLVQIAAIEGPELVTNGTFDMDVSGWAPNNCALSNVAGKCRLSASAVNPTSSQTIATTAGALYRFTAQCNVVTNAGSTITRLYAGSASNPLISIMFNSGNTGPASLSAYYTAGTGSAPFLFGAGGSNSNSCIIDWDNVSLKLITPGYLPTFPILPVAGAPDDSVLVADVVSATDFSWWDVAGLSSGASELVSVTFTHADDGVARPLFEYSDGTTDNLIRGSINADGHAALTIVANGITQTDTALTAFVGVADKAYAFNWSAAGGYLSDGSETVTFGAVTLPVVTQKLIGGSVTGLAFNDLVKSLEVHLPLAPTEAASWISTVLAD